MMMGTSRAAMAALIVALSASAGCAFSSFQTAKQLPAGGGRVGFGFANYAVHGTDANGDSSALEGTAAYGLTDQFSLGGKIAYFSPGDTNLFNLMVTPQFSLIPDKLALTASSGILISDEDDTSHAWLTMPGVVYTVPVAPGTEVNLAAKAVLGIEDDFGDYDLAGALNVGLRWTLPGTRFAAFPELGLLLDDDAIEGDETGYFIQIGFAVQFDFGPQAVDPNAPPPYTPAPGPQGPSGPPPSMAPPPAAPPPVLPPPS